MTSRYLAVLAAGALFALSSQANAADAAAGAAVFKSKCATCHSDQKGTNKIGPSLFGVVGRTAGTLEGYKYSDPVAKLGKAWDAALLDQWLTKPADVAKGTKMTFPGLPNQADRENVIAYLATLK